MEGLATWRQKMGELMTTPSPFAVAQQASNNLSSSFARVKDENAIERILSQAMDSGNPEVIQNSIGQILSQVSPERQGLAVQYLQGAFNTVQAKKEKEKQRSAAQQAGISPDLPPELQKLQYENQLLNQRTNNIFGGRNGAPQGQPGAPSQPPGQQAGGQGLPRSFNDLTDDQLIELSGVKGFSEPAKQELKRRQEDRKIDQQQKSDVFKSQLNRSSKVLERADEIAEQIPQKRTAVNLMKDAVANRNLSFFSADNLAEITGIEGLRSPEGAIFKTAGKEYFLGNIARAGARPNQWIEQQIADMMAKIGRSPEANLSVLRALENELDLDEERIRLTQEISDRLAAEGDYGQGKLGALVNKELSQYAEKQQIKLFNDLRAIKAIADNEPQKYRKVERGTIPSPYLIEALNKQFDGDWQKASEEAQKLGYEPNE